MKKQILLIISFVLVAFCSYGQTWNQYKKEAKKAFDKQDYDLALFYLDTMQKIDSAKFDLFFLQAEAAKFFNAFELAEKNYNKVLENEQAEHYAESTYGLAMVLKMQGKYTRAIKGFNDYLVIIPDTTAKLHQEVKAQIQACTWAIDLTKIFDKDLEIQQLGSAINTDFSDFSPYSYQDKLLFSSLRFVAQNKKKKSNKKYSKILQYQEGDGPAEAFDLGLSDEEAHAAHITFNKAGNQLFFSVCHYEDGSKIQCDLYTRKKVDQNNWGPALKLPPTINQEGTTTTQPAVGYDEKSGQEVLFFVSDRQGGQGGTDLWMTYLDERGQTINPQNIKALNTDKDEMSPFFHNYTQTLYFSSNGQISLGGHDVYKSALQDKTWSPITHTGFPLNSSYNDVDFVLNKLGSEGYFASNREGTRFLDKQISACCYDIFKAEFNSYLLDLNVLTYLRSDNGETELSDVTVTLYEVFEDAEQVRPYKIEPVGNRHFFRINKNKKYRIVAEKENYFPTSYEFDTKGPIQDDLVVEKVYLQPLKLNVLTFTDEPPVATSGVDVKLFIVDKDKETEVALLYAPVDSSHFFPLLSNQTYKIVAQKEDYDDAVVLFNTNTWDSKTNILTKQIILPLSAIERRIRLSNPFALYFDNNLPLPNSTDTTTDISLSEAIIVYKKRKEEFQKEYAKGTTGYEKLAREAQIADFFDVQLDTNYTTFLDFTNSTLRRLKFGRDIKITVNAYASPLASEVYNLALTKRRISSILNFYRSYAGGQMAKYVDEGKVTIELVPFGESEAPEDVSDNPYDKKNSVFSPLASQQRKVVIIGAESTKRKKKKSTNSLE